jgi:hypothetical protein
LAPADRGDRFGRTRPAILVQRAADPEHPPERLPFAFRSREKLPHRDDFVDSGRDHDQHRRSSDQAQRAPGPDGDRLKDDEDDAHNPERDNEHTEHQDHPGHRPPAVAATHEAGERLQHVRDGPQPRVGDGPGLRYLRIEDAPSAVAEDRIPGIGNVSELIGGQIAGEEEPDERHGDDRPALNPVRGVVGPAWRRIRSRCHHDLVMRAARHHGEQHREGDSQCANQRVVRVCTRVRRPEHEWSKQQPDTGETEAQRAKSKRGDSVSNPSTTMTTPLAMSLQKSAVSA